jgi:hypothetical protein
MKSGKVLSLENGDGEAGTSERTPEDGAGRPSADYDDVAM